MTTLTISRSNGAISGFRPNRAFSSFLHEIGRTIASMAAGARAAREYQELSRRTNETLARDGIARIDIPRLVFERNFV